MSEEKQNIELKVGDLVQHVSHKEHKTLFYNLIGIVIDIKNIDCYSGSTCNVYRKDIYVRWLNDNHHAVHRERISRIGFTEGHLIKL